MIKLLFILLVILIQLRAFAGRPVIHQITRSEMIAASNFIFAGWPSTNEPVTKCSSEIRRWQVYKVLKGDKNFEGKVISVVPHNYKIFEEFKNSKPPSYKASQFGNGQIDLEQSTSYIFTTKNADGCFELVANGAQEHRFKEAEIEALLSNNCEVAERGFNSKINTLPKECLLDSDCKVYELHPRTCNNEFIGNLKVPSTLDDDFRALKNKLAANCAQQWSTMGVCPQRKIPVHCKNKVCVEGVSVAQQKKLPPLGEASMTPSCAPHDAMSMKIILRPKELDYPVFSLDWWGDHKPHQAQGIYNLESTKDSKKHKEFWANFCIYQSGCNQPKSISIKVTIKKADSIIEYKFITVEGEVFEGRLPLKFIPAQQLLCG